MQQQQCQSIAGGEELHGAAVDRGSKGCATHGSGADSAARSECRDARRRCAEHSAAAVAPAGAATSRHARQRWRGFTARCDAARAIRLLAEAAARRGEPTQLPAGQTCELDPQRVGGRRNGSEYSELPGSSTRAKHGVKRRRWRTRSWVSMKELAALPDAREITNSCKQYLAERCHPPHARALFSTSSKRQFEKMSVSFFYKLPDLRVCYVPRGTLLASSSLTAGQGLSASSYRAPCSRLWAVVLGSVPNLRWSSSAKG